MAAWTMAAALASVSVEGMGASAPGGMDRWSVRLSIFRRRFRHQAHSGKHAKEKDIKHKHRAKSGFLPIGAPSPPDVRVRDPGMCRPVPCRLPVRVRSGITVPADGGAASADAEGGAAAVAARRHL